MPLTPEEKDMIANIANRIAKTVRDPAESWFYDFGDAVMEFQIVLEGIQPRMIAESERRFTALGGEILKS